MKNFSSIMLLFLTINCFATCDYDVEKEFVEITLIPDYSVCSSEELISFTKKIYSAMVMNQKEYIDSQEDLHKEKNQNSHLDSREDKLRRLNQASARGVEAFKLMPALRAPLIDIKLELEKRNIKIDF